LQKWKQNLGPDATYNNLIKVFKQAGYETFANFVEDLVKNVQTNNGNSNRSTISRTPPPPSEQPLPQLPVFPSESEQFSESPSYAAAAGVKLLKEDYRLGTKELRSQCFSDLFDWVVIVLIATRLDRFTPIWHYFSMKNNNHNAHSFDCSILQSSSEQSYKCAVLK
jgi:hypothetical protein